MRSLLLTTLLICNAYSLHAATLTELQARNSNEVLAQWTILWPLQTSVNHTQLPQTHSPYQAGQLAQAVSREAIQVVNFARYLAGLPQDVVESAELSMKAQHGATLLASINQLTHTPGKPIDMSEEFYKLAYGATTTSNIAYGYSTPALSIFGYLADDDKGNMSALGHRRWILHPPMKLIGVGQTGRYGVLSVFDRSRVEAVNYDAIAWPAPGAFPIEFFKAQHPWSLSLNPKLFLPPKKTQVQVVVTRLNAVVAGNEPLVADQSWTLDQADSTDLIGEYFNINLQGYAVPNAIIFKPEFKTALKNGDRFKVQVTGLEKTSGDPTSLNYEVEFFSLDQQMIEKP